MAVRYAVNAHPEYVWYLPEKQKIVISIIANWPWAWHYYGKNVRKLGLL